MCTNTNLLQIVIKKAEGDEDDPTTLLGFLVLEALLLKHLLEAVEKHKEELVATLLIIINRIDDLSSYRINRIRSQINRATYSFKQKTIRDMLPQLRREVEEMTKGVYSTVTQRYGGRNLSLGSARLRKAVKLAEQQMLFFENFIDQNLSKEFKDGLNTGIAKYGKDPDKLKDYLRKSLPKIADKTDSYIEMFGINALNLTRTYATLEALDQLGVQRYMIQAVIDNRTTELCFKGSELVSTIGGYKEIKDIQPGDEIITGLGHVRKVLAKSVSETNDWLTITTKHGNQITCTPNHPFLTNEGWRGADTLTVGGKIYVQQNKYNMQTMQEGSGASTKKQRTKNLLLHEVLQGMAKERHLAAYSMRLLQRNLQSKKDILRKNSQTSLFKKMPNNVPQKGNGRKQTGCYLQCVQRKVQNKTNRIPFCKEKSSLLNGVQKKKKNNSLRSLWKRKRSQIIQSTKILFSGLLQKIKVSNYARDAFRRNTKRIQYQLYERIFFGKVFNRLCFNGSVNSDRNRWGLLAQERQVETFKINPKKRRTNQGFRVSFDTDLYKEIQKIGKSPEVSFEDYIKRSAGHDEVAKVKRSSESESCYNLEIAGDDPTYLINNVIVHNCSWLDGRTFSVNSARAKMQQIMDNPENIKDISPWVKDEGEGRFSINRGGSSVDFDDTATEQVLSGLGIMFPPYHGYCRSTIVAA